jgi:hypothetical protein
MGTAPEAALRALARQFQRPLDLLRELVQNALDAGSPQVHVRVSADPAGAGRALLRLSVADSGEGMDATIVEEQLTRLFASAKTGDPSRIGEYGVGFASVFAIEPALVIVRTGRLGEAWELAFHPDGTYDLTRLEDVLIGTEVVLLKEIPASEAPRWAADCRASLLRWCAHADAPIWFHDEVRGPPPAAAPGDGWTALLGAAGPGSWAGGPQDGPGERISRPMDLGAPLQVRRTVGDVEVLAGVGVGTGYTWLCRGLTLLSTEDPACFGAAAPRVAGLEVKIRCDRLSHTLTRDNVIRDGAWEAAVGATVAAVDALAELALRRHITADGDAALLQTLRWLAPLWSTPGLARRARAGLRLPRVGGPPDPLAALEARRPRGAAWLVGAPGDPLAEAAAGQEPVLIDDAGVRACLEALTDAAAEPVARAWIDPRPWPADLSEAERALYAETCALLQAVGRPAVPCELPLPPAGGPAAAAGPGPLAVLGPPAPHRRGAAARGSGHILIRVSHPLPSGWMRRFPGDPGLAALGLAHAILLEVGGLDAARALAAAAGPRAPR